MFFVSSFIRCLLSADLVLHMDGEIMMQNGSIRELITPIVLSIYLRIATRTISLRGLITNEGIEPCFLINSLVHVGSYHGLLS